VHGIAVENPTCLLGPDVRVKYVHCLRHVPQQANVLEPRQSHVGLGSSFVVGLQSAEDQPTEDHVADHQTARADRREEKGDELSTAVGATLTTASPRLLLRGQLSAVSRTSHDVLQLELRLSAVLGRLVGPEVHANDDVVWKALGSFHRKKSL